MIRILRAFAVLRWRLLVGSLRGRRRDSLEQVSRISRLFVLALVGATVVPAAVILAGLGFLGAWGMARGEAHAAVLLGAARGVLAAVTVIVAVAPLMRFGGGTSGATRLALLPIPRRLLFAVELAGQAADPWILVVVPALVAIPAGLLWGGAAGAAAWALLAAALAVLFLAALGSAMSLLAALVFRNRRMGELVTIAVFVAVTGVAYGPVVVEHAFVSRRFDAGEVARPALPPNGGPIRYFPSELYVVALRRAASPGATSPAPPLAGLAALSLILGGAAFLAFSRLLDAPADTRRREARAEAKVRSLPRLSPASSAVAYATARLVLRSVRGKLIVFTSPLPVLVFAVLLRKGPPGVPAGLGGPALFAIGGFFALLSIGQILADQFAVDRAGLTLAFLSPASDLDLVLGKAAGAAFAAGISGAASFAVAAVMRPGGSPLLWLAALASIGTVFAVQAPVAAILAALLPAPYDLMKVKAGNPHPLAQLATMAVTMAVFGVVGGGVAAAFAVTKSGALAFAAAAVALALGCGAAALGFPLAARALASRRENLAMVAQGR